MPTTDEEMQADDGSDYDYFDENASQDRISSETNQVSDDVLPPSFGKTKTEYYAKPGESISLKCPINNQGNNVVMWLKGETYITQDKTFVINNDKKRYELGDDSSLTIKNIQDGDEDYYTCKLLPSNLELKPKLFIIKAPSIRIIEENRDVTDQQLSFREGDKIRLDCMSQDNPQPKFIWSLNGARLDKQHGVVVDKGVLIVESAQPHHSDIFQCLAENSQGLVEHKTVTIHVDCK